jgi:hypothetical protein
VKLEHMLGKIHSDDANLLHGRLLCCDSTPQPWHVGCRGGVHPIAYSISLYVNYAYLDLQMKEKLHLCIEN